MKCYSYLVDSLNHRLDSTLVVVDSVTDKNLLVTTKFHAGPIQFKFGLRFLEHMDSTRECIYNFLTGLRPGQEVLINFIQLGEIQLGYPNDNSKSNPTLIISAVPEPTQAELDNEMLKLRFKK